MGNRVLAATGISRNDLPRICAEGAFGSEGWARDHGLGVAHGLKFSGPSSALAVI